MKIYINTQVKDYGHPRFIVKYLQQMGLIDETNGIDHECVFNIEWCENFVKGTKCTLFLEGDEFTSQGSKKDRYANSDIVYITQEWYRYLYPQNTKVLKMGVDPAWHYPRDVPKIYDYVFVGRSSGSEVYDHRREILENVQNSNFKILITEGTQENYCDLMSSGRIILNVMPRRGLDVCTNFRILEGMAIGTMMTDYTEALDDWGIIPNVHYLTMDRFGETISDEELKTIHETGRKYVLENFSTPKAILGIIKDIEEFTHEEVK